MNTSIKQFPYLQDAEDIDVPDNLDQVSGPQKASTSKCQGCPYDLKCQASGCECKCHNDPYPQKEHK